MARSGTRALPVRAVALDVLAVAVFVAIGRRNHDGNDDGGSALGGIAATAWPFLIALAFAWGVTRAWRRPDRIATGVMIWPITVLAGMIVRRVLFDRGTATAFVVVATLFLGACFVGWRAVVLQLRRRQHSTATAGTS